MKDLPAWPNEAFRRLLLEQLDQHDRRFCFDRPVQASRACGRPLLVTPGKNETFRILGGWSELETAPPVDGIIPCRVLSGENETVMLAAAVRERLAQGPLNPLEEACVLDVACRMIGREETIETFLPLFANAHPKALDVRLQLLKLPEEFQKALCFRKMQPNLAYFIMERFTHEEMGLLAASFQDYALSFSDMRAFAFQIYEIALKKKIPPKDILLDLSKICCKENIQDKRALLALVSSKRYPTLTAAKERFDHHVKSIGLPKGARMAIDPFQEADRYTLSLSFDDAEHLATQLALLEEIRKNALGRLLDDTL